jgi:ABC-type proline/glycine betaine transport system permease subunit
MDAKRSAVHAGKYFLLTTLLAVVALALVGYGAVLASDPALADGLTTSERVSQALPGLALAVVGVALYRFGESWALYATLTDAHEEALADTYDTERVKADIVSVLDNRLSDMQNDLQSVNRELRKLREDDAFDFGSTDD